MATINDVVLIYYEKNPVAFARIEEITADHKPDWYHVTLLMLNLPLQTVTWILRDIYIDGEEFTMGGQKMRLEKVVAPMPQTANNVGEENTVVEKKKAPKKFIKSSFKGEKVVSLKDRFKR